MHVPVWPTLVDCALVGLGTGWGCAESLTATARKIVLSHHPIRPNPQFPKTNLTNQNLGIITKISGRSLILKSSFHGDDKNERKKRFANQRCRGLAVGRGIICPPGLNRVN